MTHTMWTVSPDTYAATKDKIDKINARAEKRGFTGRIDLKADKHIARYKNRVGLWVEEPVWDIEISGEAPSYNGWTFLASLDFDPDAGLIVSAAPGAKAQVSRDDVSDGHCDHCKTDRYRRYSYVVVNDETGEQKQVGSTCIKDFLGWTGTLVIIDQDQVERDLDAIVTGPVERRWSPHTVIAAAWAAIQVDGFTPASGYGNTPTKDTVRDILDPLPKVEQEIRARYGEHFEAAGDAAQTVLDWVASDEFRGSSDYVLNLKQLVTAESVSLRHVGLLASAPQAWARSLERDLQRQRERDELINEHVGEIKDRIETVVKIKSIRYIAGEWGTTTLYTLVATDGEYAGHVFKWFSTSGALGDEVGEDTYKIKGTVKAHDEYKGLKSTVLTRCKVL